MSLSTSTPSPRRWIAPAPFGGHRPAYRRRVRPLRNLSPEQERFLPYDSALSEFAAVGFEYGYSVANPNALVMWEAQFGDFVNGAQSVIDEFISSGEAKWGQRSDVVLMLPHGLEGQGPDHSSGRIERFLQLCAEGSMTVALPSEPANYFHLLRRHALDGVRRPLVVFTPKSMLRNRAVVSPLSDFIGGRFRSVIDDPRYRENDGPAADIHRVLLCSGKIFWELAAARDKRKVDDTAIVRIEQLYPAPHRQLAAVLERYPNAKTCAGCKRSRRTRARGPTSGSSCRRSCPSGWPGSSGSPAGGWPHPRRDRRRSTRSSRPTSSRGLHVTDPATTRPPRARARRPPRAGSSDMYATDRGIEELLERRGEETVSVEWLADRLRAFVDLNPAFEDAVERVASFLARDDADE